VQWSDTRTHAEAGNGNFGVKWRFVDQEEARLDLSTYPQFGFNTPGPSCWSIAAQVCCFPLQIAKTFGNSS